MWKAGRDSVRGALTGGFRTGSLGLGSVGSGWPRGKGLPLLPLPLCSSWGTEKRPARALAVSWPPRGAPLQEEVDEGLGKAGFEGKEEPSKLGFLGSKKGGVGEEVEEEDRVGCKGVLRRPG